MIVVPVALRTQMMASSLSHFNLNYSKLSDPSIKRETCIVFQRIEPMSVHVVV